ncbi:MAG TPA: cytochrome c family protein [Kiloniellaceae bacterium]|nr:cytochrome c family protein [Kiloniellaceae bacterium]
MLRSRALQVAGIALAGLVFSATTITFAMADGDPAAGEKVFKKCKACHVVDSDKNRVGPSLKGLIGRTPGTVEGYKYSAAMVAYGEDGAVWDDETLEIYLEKPKALVPKTKMSFPGLKKPEDRADVIAYLKTFSE